jgi:hypothetical protein
VARSNDVVTERDAGAGDPAADDEHVEGLVREGRDGIGAGQQGFVRLP